MLHDVAVVQFQRPRKSKERLASRAGHSLPAGLWPPEWRCCEGNPSSDAMPLIPPVEVAHGEYGV